MSKREATTQLLKDRIADAMLELMREKPLKKITVTEVTAKAGVGRVSYFRHFDSKEDVLAYKHMRMWEQWATQQGITTWHTASKENLRPFFLFHYENRDTILLLRQNGMQDVITITGYHIILDTLGQSDADRYRSRFFACGFAGMLEAWFDNDFQPSIDEMMKICDIH